MVWVGIRASAANSTSPSHYASSSLPIPAELDTFENDSDRECANILAVRQQETGGYARAGQALRARHCGQGALTTEWRKFPMCQFGG